MTTAIDLAHATISYVIVAGKVILPVALNVLKVNSANSIDDAETINTPRRNAASRAPDKITALGWLFLCTTF